MWLLFDRQMTVDIVFQDSDISKNIFPFPMLPAVNGTLSAYRPMSGTYSLNLVQIRYVVTEVFAHERRWVPGGFRREEIASSWEKSIIRRQLHFRPLGTWRA